MVKVSLLPSTYLCVPCTCCTRHKMGLKLLLLLLAVCSLTVRAHVDDDFAEFDDEEGEFDFDVPGGLSYLGVCCSDG